MTDHQQLEQEKRGGWPWFSFFFIFAAVLLARSPTPPQALLASGLCFLGVFGYFNNSLKFSWHIRSHLSATNKFSLACGLLGMALVVAAALLKWL